MGMRNWLEYVRDMMVLAATGCFSTIAVVLVILTILSPCLIIAIAFYMGVVGG